MVCTTSEDPFFVGASLGEQIGIFIRSAEKVNHNEYHDSVSHPKMLRQAFEDLIKADLNFALYKRNSSEAPGQCSMRLPHRYLLSMPWFMFSIGCFEKPFLSLGSLIGTCGVNLPMPHAIHLDDAPSPLIREKIADGHIACGQTNTTNWAKRQLN